MHNKRVMPPTKPASQKIAQGSLGDRAIFSDWPSFEDFLGPQIERSSIESFDIGSHLCRYQPPMSTEAMADPLANTDVGYVILEGDVRVLCESDRRQRLHSVTLLKSGDIFGVDHLFFTSPLSYLVVAASPCKIVKISAAQLRILSQQQPHLQAYLHNQMQRRSQQIFFKRYTVLHAVPSKTLSQVLLSRLQNLSVKVGDTLETLPSGGYCWLRLGHLSHRQRPGQILSVGSGWGDRTLHLADWVAQTPLQIYQLPLQPWETAELLPILDKLNLSC